ncbi:MAG TPA: methyltransferase domain-containing protein [Bacteroidia bacterium]|nr:methyltransferase domain-containing protein [Bacteroidia bacterium]
MHDWKGAVLADLVTGENFSGNWPDLKDGNGKKAVIDESGILRWKVANSVSYEFHQKHTKGAYLRKFEKQKYHQINWETPYYKRTFDTFLEGQDPAGKMVMDFGCGDGRFTEYLLGLGYDQIVCVDFDYRLLAALSTFAEENNCAHKLLLIHSDIDDLPLKAGSFDLIFSIGVLYYLNEKYPDAIAYMNARLKKGGMLFTSDPDMEGFVLRTLIFDSLPDALRSFETRRFKEVQGETDMWFRLFNEKEIMQIFRENGFEIMDKQGISMFHNYLRVLHVRGIIPENEIETNESRIAALFDYLHEHGRLFKHMIWKLRK